MFLVNIENFLDFSIIIEKELNILNQYIGLLKKRKTISCNSSSIVAMYSLKTHEEEWNKLIIKANDILNYIEKNISHLEELKQYLNYINDLIIDIQLQKSKQNNCEKLLKDINSKYSEYLENKSINLEEILKNTNLIEEFNADVINKVKQSVYENKTIDMTQINNTLPQKEVLEDKPKEENDCNILLISEKENKIYLPYLIEDLKKQLMIKKQYSNMEELIQNEYILNLDIFKNSIMSRFREAFNLIRKKEKGSILAATELGLELMFNYCLNPAIIAACKNEDELDIYLDCLEENELDKFKIFDIKYEGLPVVNIKRG